MVNNSALRRSAFTFVLPILLLMLIFMVYPTLSTLFLAFTKWNGFSPPKWNGIDNFVRLFKDKSFHASLRNLGILIAYIPLWTIFPLPVRRAYPEAGIGICFFSIDSSYTICDFTGHSGNAVQTTPGC